MSDVWVVNASPLISLARVGRRSVEAVGQTVARSDVGSGVMDSSDSMLRDLSDILRDLSPDELSEVAEFVERQRAKRIAAAAQASDGAALDATTFHSRDVSLAQNESPPRGQPRTGSTLRR